MILDNFYHLTSMMAPPENNEEAISRISEYGGESLTNLVFVKFKTADQIKYALGNFNFVLRLKVILDTKRIKTYKGSAENPSGTEYQMIITEIAGQWANIDNIKLVKPGNAVDPLDFDHYKTILKEE